MAGLIQAGQRTAGGAGQQPAVLQEHLRLGQRAQRPVKSQSAVECPSIQPPQAGPQTPSFRSAAVTRRGKLRMTRTVLRMRNAGEGRADLTIQDAAAARLQDYEHARNEHARAGLRCSPGGPNADHQPRSKLATRPGSPPAAARAASQTPVQRGSGLVIAHGRPWVGVRGSFITSNGSRG